MDGYTIEQVRDMLMQRRRRIDETSHVDPSTIEDVIPHAEMIDMAQSLEQIGRDTSLAEQERRELVAIERALAKMSTGGFGTCEDCGDDIPSKRLMIVPEARLCAHCQTFEERQSARMRSVGNGFR